MGVWQPIKCSVRPRPAGHVLTKATPPTASHARCKSPIASGHAPAGHMFGQATPLHELLCLATPPPRCQATPSVSRAAIRPRPLVYQATPPGGAITIKPCPRTRDLLSHAPVQTGHAPAPHTMSPPFIRPRPLKFSPTPSRLTTPTLHIAKPETTPPSRGHAPSPISPAPLSGTGSLSDPTPHTLRPRPFLYRPISPGPASPI